MYVRGIFLTLATAPALAAAATGASNVSQASKWAWGENIGWLNFRDAGAPAGAQGVRLHGGFLSGFAWGENIGYLNFGDGTPANGQAYTNASGDDFGVNVHPITGVMSGLAWGENIGWVNFDTAASLMQHGLHARYDWGARRVRGYAWGENVGWINLDDATRFVAFGPSCPGDLNGDGVVNFTDLNILLGAFGQSGAGIPADINEDGVVNFADLNILLTAFGTACQ